MLEHLHLLHLLEQLLLRLRLAGLRGLRAEPLDEPLELGALRALPLRLGEEPLLLLRALPLVVLVVAGVRAQPLRLEREHAVNLAVQELAVVGDEEQRAPRPAQERVEPLERRDVEVVRRLVEERADPGSWRRSPASAARIFQPPENVRAGRPRSSAVKARPPRIRSARWRPKRSSK